MKMSSAEKQVITSSPAICPGCDFVTEDWISIDINQLT
jgi:hypothetical protein